MNIDEFSKIDKTFNKDMFITKANNIFIKLFTSIMLDNLDSVKHFISDYFYNIVNNKINNLKEKNYRQMYDELNVKTSMINTIEEYEDYYEISLYIQAKYLNYILDLNSRKIVSGQDQNRVTVDYNLIFRKKKTAKERGIISKCPTCGASVDVNNNGICNFCHNSFNLEDYDWILEEIKNFY